MDDRRVHFAFCVLIVYAFLTTYTDAYKIGIGIADVTGPSVGIPFVSIYLIDFFFFLKRII